MTLPIGGKFRGTLRFLAISRVMFSYGLADMWARFFRRTVKAKPSGENDAPSPEDQLRIPSPVRLRKALESLGPSFIKLGQLMSTRADVFPPAYIDEFKKLQDQIPPLPFRLISRVLKKELQRPIAEIFDDFSPDAFAAASVAQVHTARLHSGEKVAVKIIRPGIEHIIQQDIRLMYFFARRLEGLFEIARLLGAVNLVKEFERTIFRELDMVVEAGSIEKFAANFEDSDEIYIARVHWDFVTRSVLVMEHINGCRMDDIPAIVRFGIDPKSIAMIGLRSFSRQLMEFGFFHADPHPANTIVMPDGKVSLVDFGITGYIDDETMRQIANLFLGYAEHDYDMVMEALESAGLVDEKTTDIREFRRDLKDISEPFYGRSLQTIAVTDVYDQVMALVLKYRLRLPRNLLLLLKTFIQAESLGKILNSDANILEVTRPYAERLVQKGYDTRKLFRNFGRDTRNLGGVVRRLPKYVNDILRQAASGDYQIQVRHQGFEAFDRKMEKGINRLTVGAVISASTIAAALILNSGETVLELPVGRFGIETVSLTALLGVSGYVIATILGVWLIISIFRSGRM
ncbi:MAG: AarF/ABC1/UbiB kinase family protein [Desulfobacterales bacterium]|jgi:ubiquinone biosynthesis protein